MVIRFLTVCLFFCVTVISPVRYHFTGKYDQGDGDDGDDGDDGRELRNIPLVGPEDYKTYLWTYVVFSYLFTLAAVFFLLLHTKKIVNVRQSYLGNQNSIADRTISLSGIPPELRDPETLKNHLEKLKVGEVKSISLCRDWKYLNNLFRQREFVVNKLEQLWAQYLYTTSSNQSGNNNNIDALPVFQFRIHPSYALDGRPFSQNAPQNQNLNQNPSTGTNTSAVDDLSPSNTISNDNEDTLSNSDSDSTASLLPDSAGIIQLANCSGRTYTRPRRKLGFLGLFGQEVDTIDYFTERLEIIDEEISRAQKREYPSTPMAFVTMDSVASAQMVAQAVLDPHPHFLITKLAPAPHDIIWSNSVSSRKERVIKSYSITFFVGISSLILIFPVGYVAALLNTKTISKFWPALGRMLKSSKWAEALVTGLLPTYLFTLINFIVPYFNIFLSSKQGYLSHGEEELSAVSKNFFYLFVNMFVFTLAGTASNYWGLLSDTTKIARQLAESLKKLSLFYTDLIILQGMGMLPFKLLQFGSLFRFPFFRLTCKTPRDFRNLYKPPTMNFGLQLPQPLLVLVITTIYSIMSTKIVAAGLVYFIIGFFVFKYQLVFSMVHPQHSTGKVWLLVFRRVILGLMIFQLTMAGTLALENAYTLATLLTPLPLATLVILYNFEKDYVPLLTFIALRAIKGQNSTEFRDHDNSENNTNTRKSKSRTLDEYREQNLTYDNPNLISRLNGPWLMVQGDEIVTMEREGTIRRRMRFLEWE